MLESSASQANSKAARTPYLNKINHQRDGIISIEVIIKSARRPWALDRLLRSLETCLVTKDSLRVTVVDDRSEDRYLEHLSRKYPKVSFGRRSNWIGYQKGRDSLPYVAAWQDAVQSSEAEYVLILEDDQWLCEPLHLEPALEFMKRNNCLSLNLGAVIGDQDDVLFQSDESDDFVVFLPRVLKSVIERRSVTLRVLVWAVTSPSFIVRKLMGILTLLFPSRMRPLWRSLASVNPMAGAIFLRTHWLEIWGGTVPSIMENIMISRVNRKLVKKRDAQNALASSKTQFFHTSYVSTVSLNLGTGVNWMEINQALGSSWLKGSLSAPIACEDWDKSQLAGIIENEIGSGMAIEYLNWCRKFAGLHGIESREKG